MSRFVLTAQLQLQAPNNVGQIVQQIQNQLNGVTVNVQVQNSQQAQRQLQQVTQQCNQATSAAERMGRAFALSIRRFAAFSIATRAVGLFTSTLSDAVQTSIDFERELIKISQVTGKSVGQLRSLTNQITALSTGFGVASSDLLNISTILAQAGLSAEDTSVALRTLAKSALAPNFDSMSETAEGAIAILAQFQEGVGALEKQLGSINAVAGAFAVEASDLIDVVRRTGGVFKASGGNLNELLALFTSVRATTRESAESIGTGLRTIFTRIQRPKTIEFLKEFGVQLVDLNGKFIGPYEAIRRLSEALSGLGEGDLTFIRIAEELGGFRQIGKVLPLLQQFSTAQSALNVAMRSGDSLTQDAASAQAALAVRITKVREEFLALIRSISETSTFQIMANTALTLASALIKIADSIKPLLPMLAAVAAFRIARGMGSFFGGMMSGAASGRTYNKGGKVLGFARGGLVPGTGNGDTVPAMLAPGEFVIRKSSVNKMGAGTLAAMNNNRYAYGGKARTFGIAALDGTQDSKSANLPISAIREKLGINTDKAGNKNLDMVIRGVLGSKGSDLNVTAKSDTVTLNDPGIKDAIYNNIKSQMYGLITSSATALSNGTGIPMRKRSINPNKVLAKVGTDSTIGSVFEGALGLLGGPFSAGKSTAAIDYPRGLGKMASAFSSLANMPVDAKKTADSKKTSEMLNKKIPNFFAEFVKRSPQYASFKSQLSQGKLDKLKGREFDLTEYQRVTGNSKATLSDLSGVASLSRKSGQRQLFRLAEKFAEGGEVLDRGTQKYLISDVVKGMRELQGNPTLSQKDAIDLFNSKDARGDFIYTNFGGPGSIKLPKWMGTYKPQSAAYGAFQKAQADKQNRIASAMSRQGKTMRDYETRREFATGGGVGTDTVPALLTPGEFVINRSSAQRIGYGALNRINKVGKYASGGVVQHFAAGGTPTASSFKSDVRSIGNMGSTEKDIADLSKNIKITGLRVKSWNPTIEVLTKSNEGLYKQSKQIDVKLNKYNQQIAYLNSVKQRSAVQEEAFQRLQTKAVALSTQQIAIDNQALAQEQQITNAKKKQQILLDQQNQQLAQKDQLISQAKQQKQAATKNDSTERARQTYFAEVRARKQIENSQSRLPLGGGMLPRNMDVGGAAIAVSMVTASLQAMLPPLDENASMLTQLSHSFLGLITTVAGVVFALQSFGISLNTQSLMKFLSGGGIGPRSLAGMRGGMMDMGLSKNMANSVTGVVQGFAKFLGPVALATGALLVLNSAIQAVANSYKQQAQKDIKAGNVESAGENARKGEGISAVGVSTVIGGIIGAAAAAIPSLGLGTAGGAVIGASAGAVVGKMLDDFGGLSQQASNLAMAQAGEVRSSMALEKSSKNAALAMNDFKNGTKSALDVLSAFQPATIERDAQRKRTDSVVNDATVGKVGTLSGILRGTARVLTLGAAGYAGLESGKQYNDRLSKNSTESVKSRREAESKIYGEMSESRNMAIRSGFARGASKEEIEGQLKSKGVETSAQLLYRSFNVRRQAEAAKASGDTGLETELNATADMLEQQSKEMENAFQNIALEVQRAKDAFDALNLGLRSSTATSVALSASLTRFSAGFDVGGSKFVNDVEFLQQSLSSAAEAMNPQDIKDAVTGVSSSLREFGTSEKYIQKFEGNINAFITAQANYNKAFDTIKNSIKKGDYQGVNPEQMKKRFAEELTKGMGDGEAKKNLEKVISSLDLSDTDVDKILGGDLSVFGDKLSEAQKKMIDDIQKMAQERAKAEQVLVDLTKKKIDAERNLVQAAQEAIDLVAEGRDIQAKYGGRAVSQREKGNTILARSNAESSRLGLTNLRTGSIGELRQRNAEISRNFSDVENRRRLQGGMEKAGGVKADEFGKDLEKAYKTQVDTIRSLIKLEEEQLKITQEKNKLDKESMESLIKGDVEEFFKKQSAVGATAAIASGDNRLQNYYGAEALGMAYQDIQRQQEAGVQSLYGQELGGRGGLSERAASAALSSRGITDMRAAQAMAGTTAEEEASKARLRELGGLLGETGATGQQIAEMQVTTQTVILNAAQLKFDDIMERGRQKAEEAQMAEGKYRGGLIYANRGIFVPRGTDTVPAMLTPGEFVVNRGAVQRGNNLQILQAMNGSGGVSTTGGVAAMSGGGTVRYFTEGGQKGKVNPESGNIFTAINSFVSAMSGFGATLSKNIESLTKSTLTIKLDATNVNVNINDGGLLAKLKDETKAEIFQQVKDKLSVGNNGRLVEGMQ